MWWVFRHYGYPLEQLKVLDGGLKQWQADGNAVETGNSKDRERQATPWTQVKNLHKLVGFEAVQKGIADPLTQFVDARSPDEFNGRVADGNSRSGHVPGAINFDWSNSMNILQNGKFYKKEVLDKVFCDSCHLDKDKPVITYCQRGIRAAHLAFALEQISGFKDVKVYEDSMLQYLNREDTEVA
ncbi:hypothetical protein CCR75_003296 [Bremia lactucae]|uniref:Rhodanese domain-containing protein n=1 Tax=Bremia lactucae TaxID=4779 RepID=A0A976NZF4_BRELC|nr:hypothetical protein CCR75_003296 [Bremia lactucae]